MGGWGISDWGDSYATKNGLQQKALKAMVDRLTSPLNTDGIVKQNIFLDEVPEWEKWYKE